MTFKDLRQFIDALEDIGDIVRVKEEVDWDLEAAAIARLSREKNGPIPLFENVKDYPSGYRILGPADWNLREMTVALGLSHDVSWPEFKREIEQRMAKPIKPALVKTGPCKENILKGKDVNLFQFPAPHFAPGDGGRMIGTMDIIIMKDPDSNWVNWGTYRMMIHDKRHTGILMAQNQTGDLWRTKYRPVQKPMPLAVAIGCDPYCHMASPLKQPVGISEVDYAGAFKQAPIELVKCETNDILVPAHAEIILEGEILPDVELYEGPFCEWSSHESSFDWMPVFRVNAVTYRNNPILTATTTTVSPEGTTSSGIAGTIGLQKRLKEAGIPITDIHKPGEFNGACIVIGLKRTASRNMVNQIANVAHAFKTGAAHIFIVVDEDVDVYNITEVLHTLAVRCHPGRGIIIRPREIGFTLLPYLTREEKAWQMGASVIFDCTWPVEWSREDIPPRIMFKDSYPKELQEKIMHKWQQYGFRKS
jgi:4-hydroxy-3-polyprenylbenzoate decarboxylase